MKFESHRKVSKSRMRMSATLGARKNSEPAGLLSAVLAFMLSVLDKSVSLRAMFSREVVDEGISIELTPDEYQQLQVAKAKAYQMAEQALDGADAREAAAIRHGKAERNCDPSKIAEAAAHVSELLSEMESRGYEVRVRIEPPEGEQAGDGVSP